MSSTFENKLKIVYDKRDDKHMDELERNVKNIKKLVLYKIGGEAFDVLGKALENNETVERLVIRESLIRENDLKALITSFEKNQHIKEIVIGFCYIENYAKSDFKLLLSKIFREESSVKSLTIETCLLNSDIVVHIAELLKTNTTLEVLRLFENNIYSTDAAAIADALLVNTTLEYLDLGRNNIKSDAVPSLCEMIENNNTLAKLNISHNRFETEAFVKLIDSLAKNDSIFSMNMNKCLDNTYDVERDHVAPTILGPSIANLIRRNTTLESLYLYNNMLTGGDFDIVSKAIQANTTLLNLNISIFRGQGNVSSLVDIILDNHTLRTLNFELRYFGPYDGKYQTFTQIDEALNHNTTLEMLSSPHDFDPPEAYNNPQMKSILKRLKDKLEINRNNNRMKEISLFEILLKNL